jgi:predicted acyltransferase (DUF342 family)
MTPALAFALLLAATVVWALLPLLPAFIETIRPSDAHPLADVGRDAGDLRTFAEGFRRYLKGQLPEGRSLGDLSFHGRDRLRDGTPLTWLNGRLDELWDVATSGRRISDLVVTSTPTELPGGETFMHEIYARDRFAGGPSATYRAFLGERDTQIGRGSHVARWVHSEGDLSVGDGVTLHGRASTAGTMRLGDDVRFRRINASRLVVGGGQEPPADPPAPAAPRGRDAYARIDGPFELAPGAILSGTLIVRGTVRIGAGAQLSGSLKVHGRCRVEERAIVQGAIVAVGDISIGRCAHVAGPVVSERDIVLETGATVGRRDARSSVVGDQVTLADGAQVFGTVSARIGAVTRCPRDRSDALTPPAPGS